MQGLCYIKRVIMINGKDAKVGYTCYSDRQFKNTVTIEDWMNGVHRKKISDWNQSNRYFFDALSWNKKSQTDTAKNISPQ